MTTEVEMDETNDTMGYYALLNVPATATDEEIKRAYREKIQVFHPDKQPDVDGRDSATFIRIREAYQVLMDAKKRETYDIYGQKGLDAGLEVGTFAGGMSPEEARADWARYQAQNAEKRGEKAGVHSFEDIMDIRGSYTIRVDATSLVRPYDKRVLRAPEIFQTVSSPNIQIALSPADHLNFGVQSINKRGVGGSSVVAGYRRIISPHDSLDFSCLLGLQNMFQVTSSRQLSDFTHASMAVTWQPEVGPGVQVTTEQQLNDKWTGEMTLLFGPQTAHGVALTLSRRSRRSRFLVKVELGISAGFTLRYSLQATARLFLRAHTKLTLRGLEAEAGVIRKLRNKTAAGFAVNVGIAGVSVKAHVTRQHQQLMVPVLLSHDPQDWTVLIAATILPPVIGAALQFGIVRPLLRRYRLSQAMARRREGLQQIREAIAVAQSQQKLLHAVGYRRAVQLAAKGGLVVVEAVYGVREAMPPTCAPSRISASATAADTGDADSAGSRPPAAAASAAAAAAEDDVTADTVSDSQSDNQSDIDDSASSNASSDVTGPGRSRAAKAAANKAEELLTATGELPPQFLDVTDAVRYMVAVHHPASSNHRSIGRSGSDSNISDDSSINGSLNGEVEGAAAEKSASALVFHRGMRKGGLMGFADVAPGEEKVLRIAYLIQDVPHIAHIDELQGATLPGYAGYKVTDDDVAQHIYDRAVQQQLLPVTVT